ncbi:MAG: sulfate adenylyltransferase [Actinobacteria bacterium]|nr:MAG: sulfate adenylyltransferase [Actinomycetota bacterium]
MTPPGAATNGKATAAHTHTSELLRFATAGSVDDGKSTLIGRLLFDSKQVFADQLAHVEAVSERRGDGYVNLALLTDGLRAEREQGITIDVAYRYFATPKRKFIIADTPGHEQYTRNMVTGASTADLSLVLIDARKGVIEQSKRHAYIASLLGIPHLVVCVNKMDLVGWDEEVFEQIVEDFADVSAPLGLRDVTFIPISALLGDNVVERSEEMPWYQGPTLLHHLEHVHIASDRNFADVRFPVQWVIRPQSLEHPDYRGYAGRVAGGVLRPGDEVVVLPGGRRTRIAAIDDHERALGEACPPMSVTVRLADDLDVGRGDVLCRPEDAPEPTRRLEADVCWMADAPLRPRGRYALKHTTRSARAVVDAIEHRVDVHSLRPEPNPAELALNDIGRVHLGTSERLVADPYARNRTTGSFILIDEATNDTVGAGMIVATG